MEIKEAIERCNELIKEKHANWIGLSNQKAIRNVLQELERLQKDSINKEKLIEIIDFGINATDSNDNYSIGMCNGMIYIKSVILDRDIEYKECPKNSISKDKIRDKIEELEKEIDTAIDNSKGGLDEEFIDKGTKLLAQKRVLQDLLKEE